MNVGACVSSSGGGSGAAPSELQLGFAAPTTNDCRPDESDDEEPVSADGDGCPSNAACGTTATLLLLAPPTVKSVRGFMCGGNAEAATTDWGVSLMVCVASRSITTFSYFH